MNQKRIINIYWLNNKEFKIKFMLKYLSSFNNKWLIQKQG